MAGMATACKAQNFVVVMASRSRSASRKYDSSPQFTVTYRSNL
jgi:hypothetical protein